MAPTFDMRRLTLFIQKIFCYIHGYITAFGLRVTVFQSHLGNPPGVTLPYHPKTNLPPVSRFFSTSILQLCGPIPLANQHN